MLENVLSNRGFFWLPFPVPVPAPEVPHGNTEESNTPMGPNMNEESSFDEDGDLEKQSGGINYHNDDELFYDEDEYNEFNDYNDWEDDYFTSDDEDYDFWKCTKIAM
jgi:hypothetical protein